MPLQGPLPPRGTGPAQPLTGTDPALLLRARGGQATQLVGAGAAMLLARGAPARPATLLARGAPEAWLLASPATPQALPRSPMPLAGAAPEMPPALPGPSMPPAAVVYVFWGLPSTAMPTVAAVPKVFRVVSQRTMLDPVMPLVRADLADPAMSQVRAG